MLFIVHTRDREGALDLRMANREAHLQWLRDAGDSVKAAGPWLDGSDKPAGSLLIVDMADRAELDAWLANDPYALAGLFESVEAASFRWVINSPDGVPL